MGPIADSYHRSFLYDLGTNSWNTDGANLTALELTATDIKVDGKVQFGADYSGFDYGNAVVQADCNVNTFGQIIATNHNNGSQVSMDLALANDIGSDSIHYIDLGINSSTYNNAEYSICSPNSGYLFINGGDLSIGTQTAGDILFHTGGTTLNDLRVTISDTGVDVIGDVTATIFNGNLNGNATTVTNGLYSTGTYANPSWITSLAYSKLTGTPTIITPVNADWNATTGLAQILNKPTIPTQGITSIIPTALDSTHHIAATTAGTISTLICDATTDNTPNTLVLRDSIGNISSSSQTINTHLTAINYSATSTDCWIGVTVKYKIITLPAVARNGRQYYIADCVFSGISGIIIKTILPALIKGTTTLYQQGQTITATYVSGTWYCNI